MSIDPKKTLNITDFITRINDRGVSRANRMAIKINVPLGLLSILNYKNKDDYLTYYAESVAMPGVEFTTTAFYYGGPPVTVPTRSEYRDVAISFIADDHMRQKQFFDSWINYINPKENKFDFRYRDDYIGTIDIHQISEDGRYVSYGIRLFEVFPISINEIKSSWADQEPIRIDVSFSYRYWRSFNGDLNLKADPDGPNYSFVDYSPPRQEIIGDIDVIGQNQRGGKNEILSEIDVIGTT